MKDEIVRIKEEGLLVPTEPQDGAIEGQEGLVWEKGKVDVGRVQRFWWTAPPEGHLGGNDGEFSAFFCPHKLSHQLSLGTVYWVTTVLTRETRSCVVYKPADRGVLWNVGCPKQDQPSREQTIKL